MDIKTIRFLFDDKNGKRSTSEVSYCEECSNATKNIEYEDESMRGKAKVNQLPNQLPPITHDLWVVNLRDQLKDE